MANEVFKTPDVYLKEVDNTFVRDTNNTVFGTGAITLKANQGPVNQRQLFTRFRDFQQVFGKPTSTTDYGHFAARLYMSVAPSLYVVRASYGDEHYATIQFPREVKKDYVDSLSAGNPYIKITTTAEVSDLINLYKIDSNILPDSGYMDMDNQGYVYTSKGIVPDEGIYRNESTNLYEKAIFSKAELDDGCQIPGVHLEIPTSDDEIKTILCVKSGDAPSGKITTAAPLSNSSYGDFFSKISSFNDNSAIDNQPALFYYNEQTLEFNGTIEDYNKILTTYTFSDSSSPASACDDGRYNSGTFYEFASGYMYYPFNIKVDKESLLTGKEDIVIPTYIAPSALSAEKGNEFNGSANGYNYAIKEVKDVESLVKVLPNATLNNNTTLNYTSWDVTKITKGTVWESTMEVNSLIVSGTPLLTGKEVRSINFTNYNMGDEENWLVVGYTKAENVSNCSGELINGIYNYYGTNSIEAKDYIPYIAVRVDKYASNVEDLRLPDFCLASSFDLMNNSFTALSADQIGIAPNVDETEWKVDLLLTHGEIKDNDKLFAVYHDVNEDQPKTVSLHNISEIVTPTVPVNLDNTKTFEKDDVIKEVVAIPTNQALVMYPDGYTKTCDTDEEPGIGDLESVKPWGGSSLVIGAIGPGKYANDLGIAIVTPDQYDIKALNIPNAFDWRWRFDDEDKNRKTSSTDIEAMIKEGADYKDDSKKLIWTQVYKINVYRKPSDKTAEDAWGSGKEAMVSNIPVESFLVSNDPKLVDGEGKSLYAPNVINGTSNFIYISRRSVQSMEKKLPKPTFGIFPLIGGKDGTKSGINQKQAALQLYSDPNKANFDLIFNTDAIESFASKEKYKGAQITYGEIAGSRGEALAIVQATSKEAKKLAKAQAEGKGFSFEYPSYVAMYAGYDKYFDPDLSSYVYLPKSVAAAVTEGWIMYNRNPWDAPAGVENGGIEYTTGSQLLNINAEDLGELYSNNINCSRTMPIYGEVLWGNKTAQKKNTALRSINVRVLLNYVKKNVKQILTPYIFQINNDTTRARMKNQLVNFLGGIEQQGGCTNSRVRVWCSGEDLMNHIVRVELGFIPPYTIEFIPVSVVLDSAANTIDILEA